MAVGHVIPPTVRPDTIMWWRNRPIAAKWTSQAKAK